MDQIDTLIREMEEAPEGNREFDALIRCDVFGDFVFCDFEKGGWHGECESPGCGKPVGMGDGRHSYPAHWQDDENLPSYTTSLDAALSLVPEGWGWAIMSAGHAEVYPPDFSPSDNPNAVFRRANTPALALCIAALKARRGA